jgi:anaerobic sulfite reductase subunit B
MSMATSSPAELSAAAPAMAPRAFVVAARRREVPGVWTLELEPVDGGPLAVLPGQFTMVYAFGVGEIAISVSGTEGGRLVHTIASVGAVSAAVCAARPGTVLGIRGPLGNSWPLDAARGADVVVMAGGVGLAPLRETVRRLLARRKEYGELVLLYGSRTPATLLYRREIERWRRQGLTAELIVDAAGPDWDGRVGFVTELIGAAAFDPDAAVAMVCGPEVMMTHCARGLLERGLPAERVYVSLERNMRCGLGFCGHCQLGGTLICRDGPVYAWDRIVDAVGVREL